MRRCGKIWKDPREWGLREAAGRGWKKDRMLPVAGLCGVEVGRCIYSPTLCNASYHLSFRPFTLL